MVRLHRVVLSSVNFHFIPGFIRRIKVHFIYLALFMFNFISIMIRQSSSTREQIDSCSSSVCAADVKKLEISLLIGFRSCESVII